MSEPPRAPSDAAAAPPGTVVRDMVPEDVAAVARIERESFSAPWKASTFRTLLDRPGVVLVVMEADAEVVGYAVLWCVEDQGELANIAVREGHRRRGLGSLLLDRVVEAARDRGVESLFLEVRDSNVLARGMYERRGFAEVGVRRAYYEKPREDARVLVKRLGG